MKDPPHFKADCSDARLEPFRSIGWGLSCQEAYLWSATWTRALRVRQHVPKIGHDNALLESSPGCF